MRYFCCITASLALSMLISCVSAAGQSRGDSEQNILLNCSVTKSEKGMVVVHGMLKNPTKHTLYVAIDPVDVDGKHGIYISSVPTSEQSIRLSSRIWDPLFYSPPTNYTSVRLKALHPNDVYRFNIRLPKQIKETIPPIDRPKSSQIVDIQKVKITEFQVGYFLEEPGLTQLINAKRFGLFLNGIEKIVSGSFDGKRLYEIQQIAACKIEM